MNKKAFIFVCFFLTFFVGFASAKTLGLNLLVGGVYTNHQLHSSSGTDHDGFSAWIIRSKHMGGFNAGLFYDLPKNWSVYLNTQFSFNKIFVNDTQAGFGYNFKPGKVFNLFLGGAFAFGGSKHGNSNSSYEYGHIGGGVSFIPSFMISNKIGLYMGVMGSIYKPVSGYHVTTSKNGTNRNALSHLPTMTTSINVMIGVRVKF